MATRLYESEDDQDEESHSWSLAREGAEHDEDVDASSVLEMTPPLHPMPWFQDAFEESIIDSTALDQDAPGRSDDGGGDDAQTRRRKLLHAERYQDFRAARFKQRPDAVYHPFLKLCSQIVFGMHLLQGQQAKSNKEVVRILQDHVNELDSLLERTSEDLDLAYKDIKERIRYLKLPMEHMDIFEGMLNDKKFRTDLLAGNEKIEKIIRRTAQAMNDSMSDIQTGVKSTRELGVYLNRIEGIWPKDNIEVGDVFAAMRGNEQGWRQFLKELQKNGSSLGEELRHLTKVIAEVAKLAAAASRRNKSQSRTLPTLQISTSSTTPRMRSKYAQEYRKPDLLLDKPLPREPGFLDKEILAKTHPVPFSTRYEQPREQAPTPGHRSSFNPSSISLQHGTPNHTGHATGNVRSGSVKEMTNLQSDPFRSHSLVPRDDGMARTSARRSARTKGQHPTAVPNSDEKGSVEFKSSRSQAGTPGLKQRRSNSIPQKLIGSMANSSKTPKRSETIIRYVPQESHEKKELPSMSAGFSRRLSSKSKKLPAPIKYSGPGEPIANAIDSAYSSGPDKDQKRSVTSPTDMRDQRAEVTSTKRAQDVKHIARESLRLGLFPKDTGPLTPPQTSHPSNYYFTPAPKAWASSLPDESRPSKQPAHQPKTSRTLSIRKFFHLKGESRSAMVS